MGDTPVLLSKWVQNTELRFNKAENKDHYAAAVFFLLFFVFCICFISEFLYFVIFFIFLS